MTKTYNDIEAVTRLLEEVRKRYILITVRESESLTLQQPQHPGSCIEVLIYYSSSKNCHTLKVHENNLVNHE